MSLLTTLKVRGWGIVPWVPGSPMLCFDSKTIHGLMEIRDRWRFVAIHNEEPGNGEFPKFMREIEDGADHHDFTIEIVQIWNDRLAKSLKKHGYRISEHEDLGRYAVREATTEKYFACAPDPNS